MAPPARESAFLGRIAESTFDDLLRMWVGPDHLGPARIHPDVQKIDIRHALPSISADLGDLVFSWQVKGTATPPTVVSSPVLGCTAYRHHLGGDYMRDFLAAAAEERALYLALGVAKCDPTDLLNHAPIDRFAWFAIDMTQYQKALGGQIPGYVDIPVQNRLNLGLFSLMWAARWVDAFFEPLRRDIRKPASVTRLLETFDVELGLLRADAIERSREVITGLEELGDVLAVAEHRRYAERLAIAGSLRAISAELLLSDGADQIRTYSPEALAGTVSLWLFSRVYHEFMRTAKVMGGKNERLLPLDAESLEDTRDKFFVAALLFVREFYRKLGAQVEIVQMLQDGGRQDYADFSGALRAFNWVSVDDGGHIHMNEVRPSATGEDREVLEAASERTLTAVGISLWDWGGFGGLTLDDLGLELVPPCLLLPPEDRFLAYPTILWTQGPRGFGL
jgi:hypothetical protein